MKHLYVHFFIFSLLMGCQSFSSPEPVRVMHTYLPTTVAILNPERGFYASFQLPGSPELASLRDSGLTLVHLNLRLDDWRETDIPQNMLDEWDANLAQVRQAGIKAILRFSYNAGTDPDASKAQILRHIQQLTPLLQRNADVIAWMEAGFIGAWGEWHSSTHGLDNTNDKREILHALLTALPNRYVQVRYPDTLIEMYPDPLDAARARVGHHNDCFLSSDTDVGTYEKDGVVTIRRDQAYLAQLTRYAPMSGETCALYPPRSECASALQEMELLHFSALNNSYNEDVLHRWETGGCLQEIVQRLGYRLMLTSTQFNEQVRPGGVLSLTVNLTNTGFASPVNPRPVYVVLGERNNTSYSNNISLFKVKLTLDPRTWQPGNSSFTAQIRLPSEIMEGEYSLALWLPDAAETLQPNSLYAVQFANQGTWEAATGYNLLGKVKVDASTTGNTKRSADMQVEELHSTTP